MADKVETEAALDAETTAVGLGIIPVSRDLDDLAVADIEIHLATDAAVGAGSLDLLDLPGTPLEAGLPEGDRPYGTDIGAFPAEDTFRIDVIGVKGGADFGPGAALGKIENLIS